MAIAPSQHPPRTADRSRAPAATPARAPQRPPRKAGRLRAAAGQRPGRFTLGTFTLAAAVIAGGLVGCTATGPAAPGTGVRGAATVDSGGAGAAHPRGSGLTEQVLYKLLVGELAGYHGETSLSLDSYMDVARETRDASVAARAAKLAVLARNEDKALEAARLWSEAAPSSVEARQVLASLLIRTGDVDGAVTQLEELVRTLTDPPGAGFQRAADLLVAEQDVEVASAAMEQLVRGHEDDAAAHLALARLLVRTGRIEEATTAIDRAYELDPDDARTAVLRARVRQHANDVEGALRVLEAFIERVPDSSIARMTYARLLVDTRRYEQARAEFVRLVADEPGNDDARYALGLLLVQTDRLDEAKQQFEKLAGGYSRRDAAHYYLARIAESEQRLEDAVASYRRVRRGEHRLNAQIRASVLLAESGDLEAARRHLHRVRAESARERVRIYSAEAGLLTRAERYDEAMAVYDASLRELPGNSDLLYARGMLAVQMDLLDLFERDMRDVISREPDNADALNALGYTLADRTDRYEEAYALIERAIALKPDSHYIIDSLGWVLHRMGRHEDALVQLRRAMSINPDPEIAAHVGEVLWVLGKKDEARAVWSTALEAAPDDERLLDVIERFGL